MSEQQMERLVAALDATRLEPDPDFVARLRGSVRREAASSTDSPIIQTDDLGEPVMTDLDTQQPNRSDADPPQRWWSSRINVGLAAAGALLVVGLAVGINSLQDDDEATPAAGSQTFGEETALVTTDAFFDAYNSRDEEGVLVLFAPAIAISGNISGPMPLDQWEQLLAWNVAQDSVFAPHQCVATATTDGLSVIVQCQTESEDALVQAVDAPGVPTSVVLVVALDGVAELRFVYGQPDFAFVGTLFTDWMEQENPDDASSVEFGAWSSIDEARQNGRLTAGFAQEWAEYLEANNCTFLDDC